MKARYKNAHELTIVNLGKVLNEECPEDDIWINSRYRKETRTVTGSSIIPDAINFTKQVAYEVHWKGRRKEVQFSRLPAGWRGVNVFIVDIWETSDVYVLTLDKDYVHVNGHDWSPVPS